jgi:hypothetical protein
MPLYYRARHYYVRHAPIPKAAHLPYYSIARSRRHHLLNSLIRHFTQVYALRLRALNSRRETDRHTAALTFPDERSCADDVIVIGANSAMSASFDAQRHATCF